MEFKVYQASFVLNEFHRQATDVIDPPPPTIWKTVSGNPIQILDAVASPMQKCEVTLEPIQSGSGDPSPTNVRPITGWTGPAVNVSGADTSNPTTYSVTFPAVGSNIYNSTANPIEQGSIASATGANTSSNDRVRTNGYIPVAPNTTYTVTGDGVYKAYFHYYGEQSTSGSYSNSGSWIILPTTITIPNTANYLRIVFGTQSDGAINPSQVSNVQVRDNVLYGGTYDFVSGDGDDDRIAIVFDGSETWGKNGNYGYYLDNAQFQLLSDDAPISNYCVGYAPGSGSGLNTWTLRLNTSKASLLVKPDTTVYDTTAKWKTYLAGNPLQVVFKRNESIPFVSTPQQISTNDGENNVWGDGTIELTYLGL